MTTETTALTVQQRAVVALSSPKVELELKQLVLSSQSIVSITNADGRTECHSAAMSARTARINIEKAGKAAREDATAFSKAVIAEEKRLVDLIAPEESRLLGLRDNWDTKIKAEKEAKEAAERARIEAIKKKIEAIKDTITTAALMDASGARAALSLLEDTQIDDSFAELYGEAMEVRGETIAKLREIVTAKESAEAAAARIKAEQEAEARRLEEESRRIAAERAENERIAAESRAAEEKRQAEERARLDADRAELERQRKELDAAHASFAREVAPPVATEQSALPSSPATCAGEQVIAMAPANDDEAVVKEVVRVETTIEPVATINLGEISTRLGFTVSADFLQSIGFEATMDKNAKRYPASKFPAICHAISDHVLGLALKNAA